MFDALTVTLVVLAYVGILFLIALIGERKMSRNSRLANNGLVYSFSLAVYCTSWTYYGSVGKAATSGILFLTIYFGPTLAIFFWWTLLRKLVRIKNKHKITSIADFISSRYGRSQGIAALVTIVALIGTIPYIALQLKAVINTFNLIASENNSGLSQWIQGNVGPFVVILMIAFTILFGVRRLDPTERHQGMVLALATECVVKLVAFLAAGIFVTYSMHDGMADVFSKAAQAGIWTRESGNGGAAPSFVTWMTFTILSASAILFLPRQFHVAVVENSDENHIRKAQWMLPLYLFLINLFVIPIALGGLLLGHPASSADSFVLRLPLESGESLLSMAVFIGGFSAATGMIMICAMTMSTMVTNHLLLPVIEKVKVLQGARRHLLKCRWAVVAVFVLIGYVFTTTVGDSYMLVNMGMMSFAAVLQFAPSILGGLFWKKGHRIGAFAGLAAGFAVWFYTLLLPALAKSGWIPSSFVEEGPFAIAALRPVQLLGLEGLDTLTHAVFWTMLFNVGFYVVGSLVARPRKDEERVSEEFVSILDPLSVGGAVSNPRETIVTGDKRATVEALLGRYLSAKEAEAATKKSFETVGILTQDKMTIHKLAELHDEIRRVLSGAIGAAAAYRAVQDSSLVSESEKQKLSKCYSEILAELRISPAELREKVDYYQERADLMRKSAADLEDVVERRTRELRSANEQLKNEMVEREKAEADREQMHTELVDASRKAGMADVATSVLHNVGNVLNSVNITVNMIGESLTRSKVATLGRTVELIDSHEEDLGQFLTEDERGKLIPSFLRELSQQLQREREGLQANVTALRGNVDHIKDVIDTQQSHAKSGGSSQVVQMASVIEESIRICRTGFERHQVHLERKFETLPDIVIDRHKVVQILVNLITNAKYAVSKMRSPGERRVEVTLARVDGGFQEVKVIDNGEGISKENLTRVFQHGFTTKKEGHGFGLHASACAASEMGGSLAVASEGEGRGATFTLRLPEKTSGSDDVESPVRTETQE